MMKAIFLLCTFSFALGSPYSLSHPRSWRISDGVDAAESQFPYQISLRYYGSHTCGGSILDANTILCAAHCVDARDPTTLSVRLGNKKLSEQIEEYPVKSVIIHENYNSNDIYNDISIIKLSEEIQFHEGVEAVTLRATNIGDNDDVILSGWGTNSYPGSAPNDLQFINLGVISVDKCKEYYSTIRDTELCTLPRKEEGACHGDSGGPLVDTLQQQVGIVSWSSPCRGGYPDVFTRVFPFLDWIEQNRRQ